MKKFLLGTSALVAASFVVGQANAADKFSVGVGGFLEEWLGYTSVERDPGIREWSPWGQMTDAEVHFKGNVVTDSGIKITTRIEFEANSDRQNVSIDEVWMQISTDALGMIELGDQDAITDIINKSAPEHGIGMGDIDKWILDLPTHGESVESQKVTGNSQDFSTVNYYTPVDWQKLTGLQGMATWKPNINNNDSEGNTNRITSSTNAWAVGLTYTRKFFDAVDTYTQGAYYTDGQGGNVLFGAGQATVHGYQTSTNWTWGPWEFGGSYARTMQKQVRGVSGNIDGWSYNVGVAYTMGNWAFSLNRLSFTNEDNFGGTVSGTDTGDDKYSKHMLSAKYNLSPGIEWRSSLFNSHLDRHEGGVNDANSVTRGWGLVTGIATTF